MNGSVRQRSKGTWQLRYDAPSDGTGKRRFVSETVRGNKKDAERVLRERLAAIENGGFIARDKETVSEYLHRWLDTYVATNTFLRTQQGYRGYFRRYVEPKVGKIPLQSLTARHVQGIYADMLGQGLSNTTVVQLHRILKEALSHAVKWGTLTRNVADATAPPRIERKEMPMWDIETINHFLSMVRASRFGDLYYFAVLTGLRRAEMCGLRWESVDLSGSKLSVVNTLQRITGHGMVDGQPKTPKSRRSMALSPESVGLLHDVRRQQVEQQLEAGDLWQGSGYVFTQITGKPVAPDMISKDFCKIVRKSGLPHLTLHGLRHAFATISLTAGVDLKTTSEMLGHSSIAITADIYAHVLPQVQQAAAAAVGQLLKRNSEVA
jgi:integrase